MIHILCCCNLNIPGLACKWWWVVPCPCCRTNKAFQWWLLYCAIQISWQWKRRIFILCMAWSWGCNGKHGVFMNENLWTNFSFSIIMSLFSLFISFSCLQEDRVDAISRMNTIVDSMKGDSVVVSFLFAFWNAQSIETCRIRMLVTTFDLPKVEC